MGTGMRDLLALLKRKPYSKAEILIDLQDIIDKRKGRNFISNITTISTLSRERRQKEGAIFEAIQNIVTATKQQEQIALPSQPFRSENVLQTS